MQKPSTKASEVLLILYFSFIVTVCALFVLFFHSGRAYKVFEIFQAKKVQKSQKPLQQKAVDSGLRVIKVNNSFNVEISLTSPETVQVKFPSPTFFFDNEAMDKNSSLYQYIEKLSFMLKRLSHQKGIENESLSVLTLLLSDVAKINYSLQMLNDYKIDTLNTSKPGLADKIRAYIEAIDITMKQLQDQTYDNATYYSEYTKINQISYAQNLLKAYENTQQDEYLHPAIKTLVRIIVEQIHEINNNYRVTISKAAYSKAKPLLKKLLNKAEIDHNIKNALITPLNTPLKESENAKAFMSGLQMVLSINPELFISLSPAEQQTIVFAVNSLEIVENRKMKEVIEYNLPGKFRCLREGGAFAGEVCIFSKVK